MSRYPEYSGTRSSWGIDVLGTFIVEVETDAPGFGVELNRSLQLERPFPRGPQPRS
jgi:hypothetical protein